MGADEDWAVDTAGNLEARALALAIAMNRLYHLVAAASRIPRGLHAHTTMMLRQEREEKELCRAITAVLDRGAHPKYLKTSLDDAMSLSCGCKHVFRQWVDLCHLRAVCEQSRSKRANQPRLQTTIAIHRDKNHLRISGSYTWAALAKPFWIKREYNTAT